MRQSVSEGPSLVALTVRSVIRNGLLRAVYQPLVDLDSGAVVAYEALIRGPADSPLEFPGGLFATAERERLTVELDWECRRVALEGALSAGLHRSFTLFVNIEPLSLARRMPQELEHLWRRARSRFRVVAEVTERAVINDPAVLLSRAAELRADGQAIAVDDVGVDPRSLALLPFLNPEVVKVDMSIVQTRDLAATARSSTAVRAYAERSRASIVAEGIETTEHRETALALGAHLGQGWLFGRPEELPRTCTSASRAGHAWTSCLVQEIPTETPFELLSRRGDPRRGSLDLLTRLSSALEAQAVADGESAVLIATFQDVTAFTPGTRARYRAMATQAAFVGAVGVGLDETPEPGVRGATVEMTEPLRGEWDVLAVGPYFAGAFAARERDAQAAGDRHFDFVITHDRELVTAAARSLMVRIAAQSA